jgi:ferredoxin
MPWISEETCTGCETCIDECYVGAISMDNGVAFIDDHTCIRCGVCHDICQEEAVRHDGERIPEEVESNLNWVNQLLNHEYYSGNREKQKALLGRLEKFFTKNIKVAEKTIDRLKTLLDTV